MKRAFPTACVSCRKKKIKCDGQTPCWQCHSKNHECAYQEPRKRGPKSGLLAKLKEENEKLRRCVVNLENKPSSPPAFPFTAPKIEANAPAFNNNNNENGSFVFGNYNKTLSNMIDVDLEAHQTRLFLGVYFNFVNSVVPMVEEEKFRAMYSKLGKSTPQQLSSFAMQLYGMLAIVSRISCQNVAAEQFISKARTAAKEMFDQPSEEVISGLALISYYNYGIGNRAKAGCTLALAAQMCQLVPVSESLLWACRILCVGNPEVLPLVPVPSSIRRPVSDASSAQLEFIYLTLPACFKLYSKEAEKKLELSHVDALLQNLDKAWNLLDTYNLGGSMNFANRLLVSGLKSLLYFNLGDIKRASDFANAASSYSSNKFNIFFGPFFTGVCLQMAQFHNSQGQSMMFSHVYQSLEQISERWSYIHEPLQRLRMEASNACVGNFQSASNLSSADFVSPSLSYEEEDLYPYSNSSPLQSSEGYNSSRSSSPENIPQSSYYKVETNDPRNDAVSADNLTFSSFLHENNLLIQDFDASISQFVDGAPPSWTQ